MATSSSIHLGTLSFCVFVIICTSSGVFDQVLGDIDPCSDTCDKTYSAHTYENGGEAESCKRGCRFYSIMAFMQDRDENHQNASLTACKASCYEAYNRTNANSTTTSEADGCMTGCQSQLDVQQATKKEEDEAEPSVHVLYPLMYMHSVYNNMLDTVYQHMEVSWFVFMQPDNGNVLVMRSQPRIIDIVPIDQGLEDEQTKGSVETNSAVQDNSAAPFFSFIFGPSQLKSAHSHSGSQSLRTDVEDSGRTDWLSCVARKTGITRTVLCVLLIATAVIMMWFCLTVATTNPEQQLSIHGDLEYLRMLDEKDSYKLLNPQSRMEARPLPLKLKVEQI